MCAYSIIVGDTISTVLAQYISPNFFAYGILTSRSAIICLTTFFIILPLSLNRDMSKVNNYLHIIIIINIIIISIISVIKHSISIIIIIIFIIKSRIKFSEGH